jgi:hypothetical protein
MRATASNPRTSKRPTTPDEQAPTEIKFDHDEEVEKRAEVALARRHRSLTVTEHKPPRF